MGMVTGSDAKAVAQSFLQNLQVQSLGQNDRKVNYYCQSANRILFFVLETYPKMEKALYFSFGLNFSDVS